MTCCAVCREPIEPSEYGWTLIARGEHIDDGRACLDGAVHTPEQVSPFAELSPPYSTIVADPPWAYDEGFATAPGGRKPTTAPLPYSSMSVAEIAALPVRSLAARDCWLFLWTTNAYLFAVPEVLTGWGFKYRQTLVWHKTGNPSPFGGSVAPNHAEFVVVAARGNPPVTNRLKGSVIAANKRSGGGGHSQKPPAVLDAIESCAPGPYVELFGRSPRLGWDAWGKGYEIGASA